MVPGNKIGVVTSGGFGPITVNGRSSWPTLTRHTLPLAARLTRCCVAHHDAGDGGCDAVCAAWVQALTRTRMNDQ